MFSWLEEVFTECWKIWCYEFTFAGITFSLADCAEVAVFIFILTYFLGTILDGGWGSD